MASRGAAGEPRSSDMHCHHGVPCLCREIPDDPVAYDPGVVDQDVEPTPFVERTLDHCLGVGFVDNVAVVRDGAFPRACRSAPP